MLVLAGFRRKPITSMPVGIPWKASMPTRQTPPKCHKKHVAEPNTVYFVTIALVRLGPDVFATLSVCIL